jgi:hypothetical protein
MGKGLLAWWRRRIVARGLAGAALFAVPVVVAALIGFGGGFSGVSSGLSSFTNGPDAVPAAAQTGPTKLNRAVVALASRQTGSDGSAPTRNGSAGGSTQTGTCAGDGSSGTSEGSSATQVPTVNVPTSPDLGLPSSGGGGAGGVSGAVNGATNVVNGTVNNVVGGVNKTVNGLLGGH